MTAFVVDTNVAIAANGRGTHADLQCQRSCVERLAVVVKEETIAIDDAGLIFEEYAKYLSRSGQPGVGDLFLKHVFDHQYQPARVRRVTLSGSTNTRRGFEELPENTFDPSDRKFLAVAVVAGAVVLNATDSDWDEQRALLEGLRVRVHQLCPQHASKAVARGHDPGR